MGLHFPERDDSFIKHVGGSWFSLSPQRNTTTSCPYKAECRLHQQRVCQGLYWSLPYQNSQCLQSSLYCVAEASLNTTKHFLGNLISKIWDICKTHNTVKFVVYIIHAYIWKSIVYIYIYIYQCIHTHVNSAKSRCVTVQNAGTWQETINNFAC